MGPRISKACRTAVALAPTPPGRASWGQGTDREVPVEVLEDREARPRRILARRFFLQEG
jgi:hypothetical protein